MKTFLRFNKKWLWLLCFFVVSSVDARENVTDWYIKDFQVEFVVQSDATMLVTERILADCGECIGKHGIFRVVPYLTKTTEDDISTPIELVSITDFAGTPHPFTTIQDRNNHTLTWKIGDPDKTVTGLNEYQIVYRVKNVIRDQGNFHEWYWNVIGNFWDLPIDAFQGRIIFPKEIGGHLRDTSIYSGSLGERGNALAEYTWENEHTLRIAVLRGLFPREGITLSVAVDTGIFTPYQFSLWERVAAYWLYVWFLIPLVAFIYLYQMWCRYGDDPAWEKPIIPEYDFPRELTPLSASALLKQGSVESAAVTATIIHLAIKGALRIQQETKKVLFFSNTETVLERLNEESTKALTAGEALLLDRLFTTGKTVTLSDLKYKLNPVLAELGKIERQGLIQAGFFEKQGFTYRNIFIGVGIVGVFTFLFFYDLAWTAPVALIITWILFLLFGYFMPKRTLAGAQLHAKLQGLKLYMETAEKYRQQFHEREGLFERLLPIAIFFGMTREWIQKMETLYGKEYFTQYHPAWFVGTGTHSFDVTSFTNYMESISSAVASTMSTRSGSGGSGSSGGGSGGGGGGGW